MVNRLRPFFYFGGSKYRMAKYYPEPEFDTIIEPFAGGAGYSLWHGKNRKIILNDIDPVIYSVWHYLIYVSSQEILSLPLEFNHIDELNICQEAKWLIGFLLQAATTQPKKSPSSWMQSYKRVNAFWGEKRRATIAEQVNHIRHWEIHNKYYDELYYKDLATWFIDPPYHLSGKMYKFNKIDYNHLAQWCQNLKGEMMVCEQESANWLPFRSFGTFQYRVKNGKSYSGLEMIYYRKNI